MALDNRAELSIVVANLDKAFRDFKRFETRWVNLTKRMDAAADDVEFDVTSASFKKLAKQTEAARKGMIRTANDSTKAFKQLEATGRVSGKGFQQLRKDVEGVANSAKKAGAATDKAGKQTKKSLDKASKSAKVLQTRMSSLRSTVAGLGITFIFTAAIRAMANFEKTMDAVLAVTDATDEQFKQLNETAVALGEATIFSSTQVAQGMELMGRAGFKTNEILAAMPGLLELAAAGQLDLATATDIASNTLRGFGLEAEEMTRVADVLAATAANSNTNVQQLGEGLKFVAPVAAAAGIALEEVAGAMGILSNAGLQGTLAGTGLRRVLSGLASGAPNVTKVLRQMGLTLADVDPSAHTLTETVELLASKGISLTQAFQAFGQRGAPAILVLTQRAEDLRKLTETIDELDGAAKKMAATMQDNVAGAFKRVVSASEGFIIKTGDRGISGALKNLLVVLSLVLRALDPIIDTIRTGLVAAFTLASITAQHMVESLANVLTQLGRFANLIPGMKGMSDALIEMGSNVDVAADFMKDLTANLANDFVASQEAAIDGFKRLGSGAKQSVGEMQADIKEGTESLDEFVKTQKESGELSKEASQKIVKGAQDILNKIRELPDSARAGYGEIVEGLEKVRDENRKVAEASDLTVEAMAKQLAKMAEIEKQEKSFVASVRGSREELVIRTEAILNGIATLKESGKVTEETTKKVGKEIGELLADWEKFGEAAPTALTALTAAFPPVSEGAERLSKASKGAAKGMTELKDSASALFDEVEERKAAIAELGGEVENLQKTIDELNQKQSTEGFLSAEELDQLFSAQDKLNEKQFEFGRATRDAADANGVYVDSANAATTAQQAQIQSTERAIQAAADGQVFLSDALALVDQQRSEGIDAGISDEFKILNEAWKRYAEVVDVGAGATAGANVQLEQTADGAFKLSQELEKSAAVWDEATRTLSQPTGDGLQEGAQDAANAAVHVKTLADGTKVMSNAMQEGAEASTELAEGVEQTGAALEEAEKGARGAEKALNEVGDAAADAGAGAAAAADGVKDFNKELDNVGRAAGDVSELGDGLKKVADEGDGAGAALEKTGEGAKNSADAVADLAREIEEIKVQLSQVAAQGAGSWGQLAGSINRATAACRAFNECQKELGS